MRQVYFDAARMYAIALNNYSRVECGYTSAQVLTKQKDDRMDSFFLSETLPSPANSRQT